MCWKEIATIRIRAKLYNISLICAHAPTEEKAELEDVYDKCPAHDAKIVLGDFSAKVEWEGIFGIFGDSLASTRTLPPIV